MDDSTPSNTQQSWGALISIVTIVLMLIIGALYAWGKRTGEVTEPPDATFENHATTTASTSTPVIPSL